MLVAQFRDSKGKWITIPTAGINSSTDALAFQYCKQHGVHTRVADLVEGKEPKEMKVYTCTRRR